MTVDTSGAGLHKYGKLHSGQLHVDKIKFGFGPTATGGDEGDVAGLKVGNQSSSFLGYDGTSTQADLRSQQLAEASAGMMSRPTGLDRTSVVHLGSSGLAQIAEDTASQSNPLEKSRFAHAVNFATLPQKLSLPKIKQVFVSPKHSILMRNKLSSSRKTALVRFKTPMSKD